MYQLLIIDDEPIVRKGIEKLLVWEDYGFHVCGEGIDGVDGLHKVLEYQPDLVLVDIKMPGMNGIELISEAKAQGFKGKFIILTGYSDFTFAKTAISLGVHAYLLKPIDEEELIEHLNNILQELKDKEFLSKFYIKNELKAKQEVLRRLLLSMGKKEELKNELKLYGFELKQNRFCVAILNEREKYKRVEYNPFLDEKINFFLYKLENIEEISLEDKRILIGKGYSYKEFMKKLKESNNRVKERYDTDFFITVGHDVIVWEDIHFSYESAKLLLDYQFLFGNESLVSIQILEETRKGTEKVSLDKLEDMVEIGDIEGIEESLGQLKEYYKTILKKESDLKIQMINRLYQLYESTKKYFEEEIVDIPDIEKTIEYIKGSTSLDELIMWVKDYLRELSKIIGMSTSDHVIKRMYVYMERNYHKNIKLESIAQLFNYNSAYLGKLFKKEMGESFNNTLDKIRIENAKRLLVETDLKVYQVSEKVGYSNIDYFYGKFKKHVGISPKEFKRNL